MTAVIAGVAGVCGLVRSPNSSPSGLLYSTQIVLPFTGLNDPTGVAVDAKGDVYVADAGNRRVLMLAAGSGSQTALPFTGLQKLTGVAVDDNGGVYVSYFTGGFPGVGEVVKLAAGSTAKRRCRSPTLQTRGRLRWMRAGVSTSQTAENTKS